MSRGPSPETSAADRATATRILEAAARVFAEVGYEQATIREVCARADANVAAVSYHFASKEGLYLEALRSAMRLCHGEDEDGMLTFAARRDLGRDERLTGLVRRFVLTVLAPRPEWHTRLLMRELGRSGRADATTTSIIREFVVPRYAALREAVAAFLPVATPEERVDLHVMSVTGQALYHRIAAPVALHLLGRDTYDAALVERIADHVAAFTLASLRAGGSTAPS